jgi:hypothetical protein
LLSVDPVRYGFELTLVKDTKACILPGLPKSFSRVRTGPNRKKKGLKERRGKLLKASSQVDPDQQDYILYQNFAGRNLLALSNPSISFSGVILSRQSKVLTQVVVFVGNDRRPTRKLQFHPIILILFL